MPCTQHKVFLCAANVQGRQKQSHIRRGKAQREVTSENERCILRGDVGENIIGNIDKGKGKEQRANTAYGIITCCPVKRNSYMLLYSIICVKNIYTLLSQT